jgi:hypothetical protein
VFSNVIDCNFFFRDDGIMINITTWQWAMELFLSIFIFLVAKVFVGMFLALDKFLIIIYGLCAWVVLPSFYLIGDYKFRREFDKEGFRRAFWQRLKNFKD